MYKHRCRVKQPPLPFCFSRKQLVFNRLRNVAFLRCDIRPGDFSTSSKVCASVVNLNEHFSFEKSSSEISSDIVSSEMNLVETSSSRKRMWDSPNTSGEIFSKTPAKTGNTLTGLDFRVRKSSCPKRSWVRTRNSSSLNSDAMSERPSSRERHSASAWAM